MTLLALEVALLKAARACNWNDALPKHKRVYEHDKYILLETHKFSFSKLTSITEM
jgi:hypothetical protein